MIIKDLMDMAGKDKKKRQRAHNAKKLAAGIGIAATVGVAAGVLLAPKAGKETRQDIMDKAEDVAQTTKEIAHRTCFFLSNGLRQSSLIAMREA